MAGAPQLVGEVDQQDRRFDLDPDQCDEADHRREAQRVPAGEQRDDATDDAERDYRRDDERALEGAELEHEDRENAEDGDDDGGADPAEALLPALDLARG